MEHREFVIELKEKKLSHETLNIFLEKGLINQEEYNYIIEAGE